MSDTRPSERRERTEEEWERAELQAEEEAEERGLTWYDPDREWWVEKRTEELLGLD